MPLFKTEAIVLKSINYGESDKILTFFTKDFGKIKGIAKGARRSKKRFQNALNLFTHLRLIFFEKEGMGLVRIDSCDILSTFQKIREDLKKIFHANYFLELTNEISGEWEKNINAYNLLHFSLSILDQIEAKQDYLRIFEIKLLSIFGYRPNLKRCNICKKPLEEVVDQNLLFFSEEKGGMVCDICSIGLNGLTPFSLGTLRVIEKIAELDLRDVQKIKFSPQILAETERILPSFLQYQLGKELKTLKVLKEIEGLSAVR